MNILLTGASGFIGSHVKSALALAGHDLIVVDRSSGVDFNQMLNVDDWLPYLKNINVVINCVGIISETAEQRFSVLHTQAPTALFHACVTASIERVIQISALGSDEMAFTPYQLSKKLADDVLRSLPVEWFILRPSLIYGAGGKSAALFERMASMPLLPVVDQGMQLIQPVHIDDVVCAVMACLSAKPAQRTIDVVGPNVFSFAGWLQQLRLKRGKKTAKTISVPFKVMLALSSIGRLCLPLMHPDNLRMLQQGNTADIEPLKQLLGRMPHELP